MIREIINFTNDLIEDIPDIMEWKVEPSKGLHVFIDIDDNGQWINQDFQKGKDYDYFDGINHNISLWNDCICYQNVSDYITMNKVQKFDSKQKIHSCSPFALAFNFNFSDDDKKKLGIKKWRKGEKPKEEEKNANSDLIRSKRIEIISSRLKDYKSNALKMYPGADTEFHQIIDGFYSEIPNILNQIQSISEYKSIIDKDYIRIYLRTISYIRQQSYHAEYLKNEIFNDEKLSYGELGVIGFQTTFPSKKIFVKHKTSSLINGINQRYSKDEALTLNNFEKLLKRKITIDNKDFRCLPNPLPIVVDKREINNRIVKLFNSENDPIPYKELLKKLFEKTNLKYLSDYYLINYSNTKDGLRINDFDFVPLFRFYIDYTINNYVELINVIKKSISNVFELEKVISTFFQQYNDKTGAGKNFLIGNYFVNKFEPSKGHSITKETEASFYKYRKSIYDYIYKSRLQSLTYEMFDDMAYSAILSDITKDEYKENKHTKYYAIREKLNIWFSLYNTFNNNNNNKNEIIMASKVTDLMSKMRSVAKGESNFETPEDFAFGAGQIVSYLIDRSVATNKSYSMLEPYLQKNKSNQLQDAIAQTIAIYKHDINVYKGRFERLTSQVLTDDCNVEMRPLLKYFLAGCFCPCVIYES